MKKSRFTEEQIAYAMKQAETGTPVAEVIRRMGISEQTFYRWKKLDRWRSFRLNIAVMTACTMCHFVQ